MANKNQKRCLSCGKVFESEPQIENIFMRNLYSLAGSFCPQCEAKIKKEAEGTQKGHKPM